MLLGLAILLLNVCEDHIASTCYRVNPDNGGGALKPWLSRVVGTDQVQGCACCLAKTKGISDCFMEVRDKRGAARSTVVVLVGNCWPLCEPFIQTSLTLVQHW
jgi:hypothetical protein